MNSLIYISHATKTFYHKDLEELAAQSAAKNARLDITGYLCFFQHIFVQYLEGPIHDLKEVMNKITEDERHDVLYSVELGKPEKRVFPNWNMRYIPADELDSGQLEMFVGDVMMTIEEKESASEVAEQKDQLRNHINIIALLHDKQYRYGESY